MGHLEVTLEQLEASCWKFGASQRKLGELESFFKEAPKNINCVISQQIWKNLALHWLANISGSPGPILLNFWCNNIYIQFSIQWWNPHLSILSQKNTADQERQPSSISFCKKQWFWAFWPFWPFKKKFAFGIICQILSVTPIVPYNNPIRVAGLVTHPYLNPCMVHRCSRFCYHSWFKGRFST